MVKSGHWKRYMKDVEFNTLVCLERNWWTDNMPHYVVIILCLILYLALCVAFGYAGGGTARRHDYPFRVGFIVGFLSWFYGLHTLNRLRAMNYPVESVSDVWRAAVLGDAQYQEYRQMNKADRQARRHSRR